MTYYVSSGTLNLAQLNSTQWITFPYRSCCVDVVMGKCTFSSLAYANIGVHLLPKDTSFLY